jgi:hypothetical protein
VKPLDVVAPSALLPLLFGARPKVILEARDAAASGLPDSGADGRFEVLLLERRSGEDGRGRRLRRPADGDPAEEVALTAPPAGVSLLTALTGEGRRELGELQDWWKALGPGEAPELLDLESRALEDPSRLWTIVLAHLLARSERDLRLAAQRERQLQGQMLVLRQEVETQRRALEEMRPLLDTVRETHRHLLAALLPGGAAAVGPDGLETFSVSQLLPAHAGALSTIDLHCASPAEGRGTGSLSLALTAQESREVLASWQADYAALPAGWFRCALDPVATAAYRDVELSLQWQTRAGSPVALSAAHGGPDERYKLRDAAGEAMPLTLAMLAWGGPPGTGRRGAAGRDPEPPITATPATLEYRLVTADFARVRSLSSDAPPSFCRILDGEPGLLLHPLGEGHAHVGAVLGVLPGVHQAVAVVRAGHAESPPLDFAMLLGEQDVPLPESPEDWPAQGTAFSGWVRAAPKGDPRTLTATLERPPSGPMLLLLATRVASGQDNACAWAIWKEIRLTCALPGPAPAR